jgi:hypothetical protein
MTATASRNQNKRETERFQTVPAVATCPSPSRRRQRARPLRQRAVPNPNRRRATQLMQQHAPKVGQEPLQSADRPGQGVRHSGGRRLQRRRGTGRSGKIPEG